MKKTIALSLGLLGCAGVWLAPAPAWSAAAPALSEVRVFKVESANCTEAIPERTTVTQMCAHRGPTQVYVMEVGLGNNPHASLNGAELSGSRTAVCQVGSISEACNGAGVLMGYIYRFDLNLQAGGTFQFSNSSINPPQNTLVATLSIR
ncbi:DUF4879 domain-containing protein [Pseudomonas fluorescens]|uniref:DUF4879 domain-containing protein n=1 Tax=Pseudomonas fluorescens TaxID=294 RepID=UPI001BEC629F|nr:DUF4879 domain-containing protein [Pseudomonas fluorescens]MBT2371154.1 DUF4879 domain-containing protein [Pseudomonas fluorescens]